MDEKALAGPLARTPNQNCNVPKIMVWTPPARPRRGRSTIPAFPSSGSGPRLVAHTEADPRLQRSPKRPLECTGRETPLVFFTKVSMQPGGVNLPTVAVTTGLGPGGEGEGGANLPQNGRTPFAQAGQNERCKINYTVRSPELHSRTTSWPIGVNPPSKKGHETGPSNFDELAEGGGVTPHPAAAGGYPPPAAVRPLLA